MQSNPPLAVVRHLLYNHNPFYVISAVLVLYGVWRSVAGQEALTAGWPMFGLLCGYIALLAAAAWAVIRLGGVWQDARTLLVVIVLMLVGLSMSFDAIAVLDAQAGRRFLLLGLAFALAASEATLRGLRIRLSWFYRGPYYAALGLLFVYPLWLAEVVQREDETLRAWSLMLFPTLAAAIFLMLLPAARWGRERKWATGTPWPWPLFPWTLFFFLALGLGVRSYSLAYAFEGELSGASGFHPFWLAPLAVACAALLLEMGISANNRTAQRVAVLTPLGLVPLSLIGHGGNATQAWFLTVLQESLAGPAALVAGMLIAFYAWAWLQKAPLAELGLMAALALAALVDSATVDWRSLAMRHTAPLGAIVLLQTILSVRLGASWRMMLVAALAILTGGWAMRGTPLVQSGYGPVHLFLLAAMAISLTFDDRLARSLRRAAAYLLPAMALLAVAAYPLVFPRTPPALHTLYAAGLAALAALCWRREQQMTHLTGSLLTTAAFASTLVRAGYAQLDNTPLAAGRDWLAAGLACLAVGLLISLAKGGVLQSVWSGLAAWNRRLQSQPPT